MEQAKLFAHASGNQDLSSLTGSWLQKFKQKHGVGSGRLMRRASETNIPDSARMSTGLDRTAAGISPTSPTHQLSPLSGSRSDEDLQADGFDFDFPYRQTASHSSVSLNSGDNAANTFSGAGPLSPVGPFNFSPDPNTGAFSMDQNNLHLQSGAPDFQHREKRSNTFPSINVDYANQVGNSEPVTPRHPSSATVASSTLESPSHEAHATPFTIDTSVTSPPSLRRSSSNSSIATRSNNTPAGSSAMSSTPVDSSPVSPTAEDARRAASTLLSYLQSMTNGPFDQSEYMAVVHLTKKLQIHQHQTSRPSMGGLSRIPEGDGEVQVATGTATEAR